MWPILLSAASAWYLTGLSWTVGLVVYPSFNLVDSASWKRFHEHHSTKIAIAVGPAWLFEALGSAWWLLTPRSSTLPYALANGILALGTVLLTVFTAVPLHNLLSRGSNAGLIQRLNRWHLARSLVWSSAALASSLGLAVACSTI